MPYPPLYLLEVIQKMLIIKIISMLSHINVCAASFY